MVGNSPKFQLENVGDIFLKNSQKYLTKMTNFQVSTFLTKTLSRQDPHIGFCETASLVLNRIFVSAIKQSSHYVYKLTISDVPVSQQLLSPKQSFW